MCGYCITTQYNIGMNHAIDAGKIRFHFDSFSSPSIKFALYYRRHEKANLFQLSYNGRITRKECDNYVRIE